MAYLWRFDGGANIVDDNANSLQDAGGFVTVFSPGHA
jgi:hypothetical protein